MPVEDDRGQHLPDQAQTCPLDRLPDTASNSNTKVTTSLLHILVHRSSTSRELTDSRMKDIALLSLPGELLECIFKELDDSPHSIRALALTNKAVFRMAAPFAHRCKTIVLTHDMPKIVATWLENPYIRNGTREITVERPDLYIPRQKHVEEDQCEALTAFIRGLFRLKSLNWAAMIQIPITVLDAIHQHTRATLAVSRFARPDHTSDYTDPAELALAASPALTSIHSIFTIQEPMDLRASAVRRIIMQAPNLRSVSYAERIWGGWSAMDGMQRGIAAHHFSEGLERSTSVRSLEVIGNQLESISHDWDSSICLENLNRFAFGGRKDYGHQYNIARELHRVADRMTGLKELSLSLQKVVYPDNQDPEHFKQAVTSCLTTLPPLVSLHLDDWMGVVNLPVVLAYHGNTLRELALHMLRTSDCRPKLMMGLNDRNLIKKLCPHLTDLGMDIQHRGDPSLENYDDHGVFGFLASMCLKRVHLYFDWDSTSSYMDPNQWEEYLTFNPTFLGVESEESFESFVLSAWRRIFAHEVATNTHVVRELEITSSMLDHDDCFRGPRDQIPGAIRRKSRWVAKSHERDDRPGECQLVVAPPRGTNNNQIDQAITLCGVRRRPLVRQLAQRLLLR